MINPSEFITINDIEENINKTALEEECNEFISFNKECIYQYNNLFKNIIKLIHKLDDKSKYNIHKFITNNISKLYLFKSKTLLPCYISIYYLCNDNIILNSTMCKFLFTLEVKQNKIRENINIISNIDLNNTLNYPINNISSIIRGWVYTIDCNLCKNLLKYFEIIPRLILFNLKLSNRDIKISTIPTHFDIHKTIDNYVFILLHYIYNNKLFNPHFKKIELIYDLIYKNIINKTNNNKKTKINNSHYKIIYCNYIIDVYIRKYVERNVDNIIFDNCCTHY
ncbi:unknown similar to AMEV121 [Adoxophyes honmai entomopoxvirus 'L']|uniref:Uncharacterized protein n=1 Tax=Adoxophyes honmai entomopoxvirus 'L' TaxID=1293540 RepID=A0A916KP64_9POXV|nr:unknown similar to AMEV121 [Adoxophyes honmai entomopoxvirus 'L']CCU55432.1 unknown similar to AMEV121 [Adoxophyes honmai entomopoxvirus 'L']